MSNIEPLRRRNMGAHRFYVHRNVGGVVHKGAMLDIAPLCSLISYTYDRNTVHIGAMVDIAPLCTQKYATAESARCYVHHSTFVQFKIYVCWT
jgi:hypothetical protein